MKAKKIFLKRLFSLGNYENMEIGIELEIESGEIAKDVLLSAQEFVNANAPQKLNSPYNNARRILENKDVHSYGEVRNAEQLVKSFDEELAKADDLPF